jgi:hypothetical protein
VHEIERGANEPREDSELEVQSRPDEGWLESSAVRVGKERLSSIIHASLATGIVHESPVLPRRAEGERTHYAEARAV